MRSPTTDFSSLQASIDTVTSVKPLLLGYTGSAVAAKLAKRPRARARELWRIRRSAKESFESSCVECARDEGTARMVLKNFSTVLGAGAVHFIFKGDLRAAAPVLRSNIWTCARDWRDVTRLLSVCSGRGYKRRACFVAARAKDSVRGPSSTGAPTTKEAPGVIDVNPPRGTRDFPPDDMRLRSWLFSNFREVSRLYGFEEIDFPVLESEELYIRKAGEEITQQLYNFEDKGGRKVALRPELTPSLARLVIQKGKSLSLPLKWYGIGQCWRYERMTRGRRREHYQWNMDIIGVAGVEAEAELLSSIVFFFSRLGITSQEVGFKVSNRKVLQSVLSRYDINQHSFAAVCVIVDKIEKVPRAILEKELTDLGVPVEAVDGILQALAVRSLHTIEELLGSDNEAVIELKQLFALAEAYGFGQWLQFDASVVRGLAYYTGTVFEAFDKEGNLRAICGGGRYDKLLSTFGGSDTPACGFGFGDAVIIELLKERRLMPHLSHDVDDIVLPMEEQFRTLAARAATLLRAAGRSVDLVMESKKMKWAFKHAERLGAKRLVLVGSTEWEKGMVRVKDLASRKETDLPIEELGQ